MIRKATKNDIELVVDILIDSFKENKSVKYVVKQDHKKEARFKFLMIYSFKKALIEGNVFINKTNDACLLMIHKNQQKLFSVKSIGLDVLLVLKTIGLFSVFKAFRRQKLIEKEQPNSAFLYLWYVGVFQKEQGKGKGSDLVKNVLNYYKNEIPVYLETSTKENFKWYETLGFKKTKILQLGYELHVFCR